MRIELHDGAGSAGLLYRLNPLSKLLAIAPLMGLLTLVTDPYTPLAFAAVAGLVTIVLGRMSPVRYARLTAPFWGLALSFVTFYPLIVVGPEVASSDVVFSLGPLTIRRAGLRVGAATGLRILALSLLTTLFVLTTETESFLRALVQNLGMPYQIGYTAMAAFRFVPMIRSDVETIRAAHTVRGAPDGDGVHGRLRRAGRYTIPLFVNAIRRAERTALAMDARAFGAFDERTHYCRQPFTRTDVAFVVLFWTLAAGIVWILSQMGLLGALTLLR